MNKAFIKSLNRNNDTLQLLLKYVESESLKGIISAQIGVNNLDLKIIVAEFKLKKLGE